MGAVFALRQEVRVDSPSLFQILNAATQRIPNELLRNIVITRVFVRTGVNLRQIHPQQASDPQIVGEILKAFEELGYPLSGV